MTREETDSGDKSPSPETADESTVPLSDLTRPEVKRALKWIALVTTVLLNSTTLFEKPVALFQWLVHLG